MNIKETRNELSKYSPDVYAVFTVLKAEGEVLSVGLPRKVVK